MRYDALDVVFDQPALVFQGKHDDTVDSAMVQRWSRGRSKVNLHLLDDDHRLSGVNGRDLAGVRALSRGLQKDPTGLNSDPATPRRPVPTCGKQMGEGDVHPPNLVI